MQKYVNKRTILKILKIHNNRFVELFGNINSVYVSRQISIVFNCIVDIRENI